MNPEKEQLFETVFREQGDKLYRWIYKRCGNKHLSEDITSECFIRTFEKYDGPVTEITRIIFRVADNLLMDHFRAKMRDERLGGRLRLEASEAADVTPETEAVRREQDDQTMETAHRVRRILTESERLKESHKKCLHLRLFENKTPKEISAELMTDYVQVKNLLQYGLKILKEELSLHG